MTSATEFIDEPDTIRNEAIDNDLLVTNNRTIELREKLDELGIKHLDSDLPNNKQTRWNKGAGGWGACYVEITHGSILPADSIIDNRTLRIYDCTPEKAIAATLGSAREKALEELVWYMWREITTCPDYQISPCMTPNICDRIRELEICCDSSKFDTKAETISTWNICATKICEVEETFTEPVTLDYIQEYRCHRCGEYSYMQILYSEDKINYCSHCGAKVIY